jgi:adenylate cyclase
MYEKQVKRGLKAILSADVKGYSRLMEDDDEATVNTIKTYRKIMADLIASYEGRVVDAKGDNVLAAFASTVNAVRCAVAIQKELKTRNAALAEHRRMYFRIGINMADVIEEEGNLYGNGVNIAARLEGLTEPGGVSISGTVFDQVSGKIDIEFEPQGEHQVKNISKPIRVFRIKLEDTTHVKKKDESHSLPDKPSIAVLPFVNMSGDAEQEYFSDGLTEDLITDLSKISSLFVIARNSVFAYKGKSVKVEEIGRDLGVRYLLEGSVRKSSNRVRITTQLIDTITKGHIWADRFDSEIQDIFDLQDEVTQKIVSSLALKLR